MYLLVKCITGDSAFAFAEGHGNQKGPTQTRRVPKFGALAQLGERLICIQEVRSSILLGSTKLTKLVMAQQRWVGSSAG